MRWRLYREKLLWLRVQKGWSQREAAEEARIYEKRQWARLENGESLQPNQKTLELLKEAFQLDHISELILPPDQTPDPDLRSFYEEYKRQHRGKSHKDKSRDDWSSLHSQERSSAYELTPVRPAGMTLDGLIRSASHLDAMLLQLIRDHQHASEEMVRQEFRVEVESFLRKRGTSQSVLLEQLARRDVAKRLLQTVSDPSLIVDVAPGCMEVRFHIDGQVLGIRPATLLWDCHCKTPSFDRSPHRSLEPCPIHTHPLGSRVDARFGRGLVKVRYEGAEILWRDSPALWPPSIDTFHMIGDLSSISVFDAPFSSVLDLGCGTGLLGITAAIRNPHTTRVVFADWLLSPIVLSACNWVLNDQVSPSIAVNLRLGLNTDWGLESLGQDFDLLLCNPPYLPIPQQFAHIKLVSTVAGTDLLQHAIEVSMQIAERSFIAFSGLAATEAEQAAEQAGVSLRAHRRHVVPFRVRPALDCPEYLEWLIENRGLQYRPGERYSLWHEVGTYEVLEEGAGRG